MHDSSVLPRRFSRHAYGVHFHPAYTLAPFVFPDQPDMESIPSIDQLFPRLKASPSEIRISDTLHRTGLSHTQCSIPQATAPSAQPSEPKICFVPSQAELAVDPDLKGFHEKSRASLYKLRAGGAEFLWPCVKGCAEKPCSSLDSILYHMEKCPAAWSAAASYNLGHQTVRGFDTRRNEYLELHISPVCQLTPVLVVILYDESKIAQCNFKKYGLRHPFWHPQAPIGLCGKRLPMFGFVNGRQGVVAGTK